MRISRDKYYLNIAEAVSKRSPCLRRQYGSVIVKNDEIIATGYNGVPRGCKHCETCNRMNVPRGENYLSCPSVHAEANAIISAARRDMIGATLYLACNEKDAFPCKDCQRLIINAGISKVITEEKICDVQDWIGDE